MKTLLISVSDSDIQNIENLGIERIYAYLKSKNKEVDMIYINRINDIQNEFNKMTLDYDIYAFSVYHTNFAFVYELSVMIKSICDNKYIVLGSKFVTTYFEDILHHKMDDGTPCFDCLVLGDGEYTMLEIINCVEQGNSLNEYAEYNPHIVTSETGVNKKPLSININELPLPERHFLKITNHIVAYICDSHGCIGKCSFCTYSTYHSKWTGRTAECLFNEVKTVYENTNARLFMFSGSSFEDPGILGKARINDFCDLIIESKLRVCFRCFLRADTFNEEKKDVDLLIKMKKAGFNHIFVGIESANDDELRRYNKTAKLTDNYRIMKLLDSVGIFSGGYGFIMFNPYSTFESIQNNYCFIAENQPFQLSQFISKLIVYKGTKIHEIIKKDNLLKGIGEKTLNLVEEYKFQNNDVEILYEWVKSKFNTQKMHIVMQNADNVSSTINCFSHFVGTENVMLELTNILSHYEIILKEYFFHLYINNDIEYCEKLYDEFSKDIFENNKKLEILKNKFFRLMMKNNIFCHD